jgi:tetratricopeptide (TPR) repeat protein
LERLATASPFDALGLTHKATGAEIRASFLKLTKQYHPSRYARMDRDVVRLANEVFLRVKDAYARLSDEESRAKLVEMFAPAAPKTESATPNGRAPTERWHPSAKPKAAAIPAGKPGSERRPTARGTPRARIPTARTGIPTARTGIPTARRTATKPGVRPQTKRSQHPTDANELGKGLQDTVRRNHEEYEAALRLLTQGRYADARTVFHRIAAADPKTKKFRVQMHYAWGLEHEDGGDFEAARKEYERALSVDPQFKRAHEALDKLPGGKKGSGFLKKFFGR